jgi:hypothetical protein
MTKERVRTVGDDGDDSPFEGHKTRTRTSSGWATSADISATSRLPDSSAIAQARRERRSFNVLFIVCVCVLVAISKERTEPNSKSSMRPEM